MPGFKAKFSQLLHTPISRMKNKKDKANIATTTSLSDFSMNPALEVGSVDTRPHSAIGQFTGQGSADMESPEGDLRDQTHGQNQFATSTSIQIQQDTEGTSSEPVNTQKNSALPKSSGKVETALQWTNKGLGLVKELSEFIPVPGIGTAIGAVSKCIQVYLQASENKEQVVKLTEELVEGLKAIQKYGSSSGGLSEIDTSIENLKRKLESICDKVDDQPQHKESMFDRLSKIANAEQIQEEIKGYFNEVQTACNTFQTEAAMITGKNATKIQEHLIMKNFPYSHNAMHDADLQRDQARNECIPGTRKQILEDIGQWATNSNASAGYWLCGMAGTGKSTIAKSVYKWKTAEIIGILFLQFLTN
ncbi:hypothetical protein VKT23_019680 [Stygiomarasmius scandens]|uniref:NACHT-NTPase and P-loop NTPases N-terminal domain-containing protein n=1 Tax=Marasmiellus scandens TaxID=2682957 RepID=A0ABR1INR9_9AGAR